MITSFAHKGLRRFFEEEDASKLPAQMLDRIETILDLLNAAAVIEDIDQASLRLHALKGQLKGYWAVTVRANWRIIFKFKNGNATDVDFTDYH